MRVAMSLKVGQLIYLQMRDFLSYIYLQMRDFLSYIYQLISAKSL